jgi:hypothetical protein
MFQAKKKNTMLESRKIKFSCLGSEDSGGQFSGEGLRGRRRAEEASCSWSCKAQA